MVLNEQRIITVKAENAFEGKIASIPLTSVIFFALTSNTFVKGNTNKCTHEQMNYDNILFFFAAGLFAVIDVDE